MLELEKPTKIRFSFLLPQNLYKDIHQYCIENRITVIDFIKAALNYMVFIWKIRNEDKGKFVYIHHDENNKPNGKETIIVQ